MRIRGRVAPVPTAPGVHAAVHAGFGVVEDGAIERAGDVRCGDAGNHGIAHVEGGAPHVDKGFHRGQKPHDLDRQPHGAQHDERGERRAAAHACHADELIATTATRPATNAAENTSMPTVGAMMVASMAG